MATRIQYRKTIEHFDHPGHVHELTFSCFRRQPLLPVGPFFTLLAESLDRAVVNQRFQLNAFVFMPEHVHLLVFPESPDSRISDLLFAIKRPFSFRAKQWLEQNDARLLHELTTQERPGKYVFRFWQEGPGYDRNLTSMEAVRKVIDYIHMNPIRRGLCQAAGDWRWSSYRRYERQVDGKDPEFPTVKVLCPY